jgi:hypothetical protein
MMLATCMCDWKCLIEEGLDLSICQNSSLSKQPDVDICIKNIIDRYLKNPITQAVVIAGLEPILQIDDVIMFIEEFRKVSDDDIVIYTGYTPDEVKWELDKLILHNNIIVKFGRFKKDAPLRYDPVLGIELISDNQFAVKIS